MDSEYKQYLAAQVDAVLGNRKPLQDALKKFISSLNRSHSAALEPLLRLVQGKYSQSKCTGEGARVCTPLKCTIKRLYIR